MTDSDIETYFSQYGTVTSIDQKVCIILNYVLIETDKAFVRCGLTLGRKEDMAT